jgi:cyanate permease
MILLLPVHIVLPCLRLLGVTELTLFSGFIIVSCMILIGIAEVLTFTSVIILITESVSDQPESLKSLGLIHGLASTCAALVRAFSPTISGALWEFGKSRLVFSFNGILVLFLGIGVSVYYEKFKFTA